MSFPQPQARVLKLQTLLPDSDSLQGDIALISTFSVKCPDVPAGTSVFEV
jgi:hypothetical protein